MSMTQPGWQPVPRVPFNKLHDARTQAHVAAQWLARVARAYVPSRPDDSHTNLGWLGGVDAFATHALPDGSSLGLRIADLSLAFLGSNAGPELSLDGRAEPEVRAWLGRAVAAKGLDPRKLDAPVPYDIPGHVIAVGARYSIEELVEPSRALAAWIGNASAMLGVLGSRLAARKLKAPPVRCWPHHFDFDTLVALGHGRTMGVGFSPGDEYCDEPYFYVTLYPEPSIPGLPLLPALGHWHTHEFLAAFAPAHKIVAATDQRAFVENFLDVATGAALDALT